MVQRMRGILEEIPLLVAAESGPVERTDEISGDWGGPCSLVLVVNAEGMEMRILNEAQVAALARKPGCEFALTPDAVMWVSECGVEAERFSPGVDF